MNPVIQNVNENLTPPLQSPEWYNQYQALFNKFKIDDFHENLEKKTKELIEADLLIEKEKELDRNILNDYFRSKIANEILHVESTETLINNYKIQYKNNYNIETVENDLNYLLSLKTDLKTNNTIAREHSFVILQTFDQKNKKLGKPDFNEISRNINKLANTYKENLYKEVTEKNSEIEKQLQELDKMDNGIDLNKALEEKIPTFVQNNKFKDISGINEELAIQEQLKNQTLEAAIMPLTFAIQRLNLAKEEITKFLAEWKIIDHPEIKPAKNEKKSPLEQFGISVNSFKALSGVNYDPQALEKEKQITLQNKKKLCFHCNVELSKETINDTCFSCQELIAASNLKAVRPKNWINIIPNALPKEEVSKDAEKYLNQFAVMIKRTEDKDAVSLASEDGKLEVKYII